MNRNKRKKHKMSKRIIPTVPGYTKIQAISFVKVILSTNDIWAKQGCLAIWNQQTSEEKTKHLSISGHNGCGFGKIDAPIMTHLACKLRQHRETIEDLQLLKRKLSKYAKQLICLSYDKDKYKNLLIH